jgi:hypothetical protein
MQALYHHETKLGGNELGIRRRKVWLLECMHVIAFKFCPLSLACAGTLLFYNILVLKHLISPLPSLSLLFYRKWWQILHRLFYKDI